MTEFQATRFLFLGFSLVVLSFFSLPDMEDHFLTEFYRLSLSRMGRFLSSKPMVIPSFIEISLVLSSFSGFYGVLPSFTGFYLVLLGFTVLPSFA